MNVKRVSGIAAIVLGAILIWFSIHSKNKVNNAKEGMDQISSFFPKDQVSSAVEGRVHSKLSQYDVMIRLCMIGGIILVIGGVFVVLRSRRH